MLPLMVAAALAVPLQDKKEDSPPLAAVRSMQKALQEKDWTRFYETHAHPQLRTQLTSEKFKAFMEVEKGKPVIEIFDQVLRHADARADKETLVAQPQQADGEYEFILPNVKALRDRQGAQWHLELKLDGAAWKFLDTD